MLVCIDETRKVLWYNTVLTKEEGETYLSASVFWFDEMVLPPAPAHEEGKNIQLFLSAENTLVYERLPFQPPEKPAPTSWEILMQELAAISLQNLEAQQERQLFAQQVSDLELALLEGGASHV